VVDANVSLTAYEEYTTSDSDADRKAVAVEPAFTLEMVFDITLWEDGWKRNVLLVSLSALLFVLRTVAYLLRQEQQHRNAQEIANCGGGPSAFRPRERV